MSESSSRMTEALRQLARGGDEPLAALADALTPAVDAEGDDTGGASFSRVRELIASLVRDPRSRGTVASDIIEALLRIDRRLSVVAEGRIPFATRLAPLAAACAVHAEAENVSARFSLEAGRHAPIFMADRQTLYAAPTGVVDSEGFALWADRVLSAVLAHRPKRVVFVVGDQGLDGMRLAEAIDALADDLVAQNVVTNRVDTL